MFDKTNLESFQKVEQWTKDTTQYCKKNLSMLLIANKCDLKENIQVDQKLQKELCENKSLKLIETSAKENINIEESFDLMVRMILSLKFPILKEYLEIPELWKPENLKT